ncbi:orotidine-5'-phosphate decarboxylase [Cohnella sp. 56]|uniref:orotidine-5'-phosphate decarboxylase n=1 Tax=Cohnella sp. 56 TaxID=3113722 RepID=UPI0030E8B685
MALTTTRKEAAARIMVGLDKPDVQSALKVAEQLEGTGCWVKVGMELFYAAGHDIVRELKRRGFRIFLDLKMHDIPNTVRGGARSIARMGIDMFNVHAAGGSAMMQAAMQGVSDAVQACEVQAAPLVIAVTQLTSTSRETLNAEIGIPGSVEEAVVRYAVLAKHAGLQGVVASPLEVAAIKSACGEHFLTVTPGIRPAGAALGDQTRVTTPREAVDGGTDFLVIGRPIVAASDPAQAFESILKELTQA